MSPVGKCRGGEMSRWGNVTGGQMSPVGNCRQWGTVAGGELSPVGKCHRWGSVAWWGNVAVGKCPVGKSRAATESTYLLKFLYISHLQPHFDGTLHGSWNCRARP